MQTSEAPKTALRIIAALAAVAAACSGYLLYQSVSGNYNPCCGHVLDSRWAKWFGVPVSAFSVALYIAILAAALAAVRSPGAGRFLRGAALLAGGAALWFFAVLFFIEKATCPYCIATHLCGLGIAGISLGARRKLPLTGALPFAGAGAALAAMVIGQLLSGGDVDFGETGAPGGNNPSDAGSAADTIAFSANLKVKVGEFPHIGPESPTHYIAEIFDYTCANCRDVYGDIKLLEKTHPGVFAVIYIPAPLNRSCNVYLPARVEDHKNACELARAGLAVWAADPTKFGEFHDSLMTRPLPIEPADAEAKAISLVGKEAFEKALRSPALERTLQTGLGHYASAIAGTPPAGPNIRMPKVLVGGGGLMHGSAPSPSAFVKGMAKHFKLE